MFGKLGDMAKMMGQFQEIQSKMTEMTEKIQTMEAEGSAGAGMVTATANGSGEVKSLSVDPSLLGGGEEKEVLEDLIVAAVNDATKKAREAGQAEMMKLTEGLNLPPGMKLPGM